MNELADKIKAALGSESVIEDLEMIRSELPKDSSAAKVVNNLIVYLNWSDEEDAGFKAGAHADIKVMVTYLQEAGVIDGSTVPIVAFLLAAAQHAYIFTEWIEAKGTDGAGLM